MRDQVEKTVLKSVEARVLKVKRMGANVHVEGMTADIRSAHQPG